MSDLMERARLVKLRWSMRDVVEQLIGEEIPSSNKINSPFNEADNTPSCHIYEDSFYDYSTGKWGDVIDLIRQLRRCSLETAVELLESEADELGLEACERVKAEKPKMVIPWDDIYTTNNCSIPWDVLKLPGIADPVIERLWRDDRIGVRVVNGERLVAMFHCDPESGDVVGIKYRTTSGRKVSELGSDYGSFLYWPWQFQTPQDYCIITEGETDSWAWLSVHPDHHVYSLPSGAQSWRDRFLEQLNPYRQIFIAFDNDKAGKDAEDKVTRAIGWGRAERVVIPPLFKDVREAIAGGWVPST